MIPLSRPSFMPYIKDIERAVHKLNVSGMIAAGEKVKEFEGMIADYVGVKHAVAVSSGTAGLIIILKAMGIGEGDVVITSPFSFVASTNCILEVGARVKYVDIDRDTYNIDMDKVNKIWCEQKVKAVLPVDVFGNPVDTGKLPYGLPTVLDSCESLGSKMGRPFDACVYAFYPNKQVGIGEGGMICTNNDDIADFARSYRNQGRAEGDKWLDSSKYGLNYRMTDIEAVYGIEQMKHIDEIVHKRRLAEFKYLKRIGDIVNVQTYTKGADQFSPFVFTVEVDNRDKVMQGLLDKGIECKPYFPCIHKQGYMNSKETFPIAEYVSSRTLALPFWSDITDKDIDTVCKTLRGLI